MAMTMLYIWVIGTVVGLTAIYVLLRRWYSEEAMQARSGPAQTRRRNTD